MKTTRYMIFLAAAALAACTPESLGPEQRSDRLRGVIESDMSVTKSILVDSPGVKLESFWQAGDQIGVYGGNAENALFSLKAEDLSANRKTADFSTDGTIPGGKLTAYSPYQKDATKDGNTIVVTFPARQDYVTYNGVVQPDPAANILLGEGSKAGGLTFLNMTAVLKIGQVFEAETLVKTVEFRDLSGAAVTGAMKLTGGTSPKAEITGDGKVLTLDMGEGVEFAAGSMRPLFLIVPARAYPQGFEITFIDSQGGKTVKTVGVTKGKTLERGVVYLIGDISGQDYPAESKTVLKEGATIMTPALLDKSEIVVIDNDWVRDENGDAIRDEHNVAIRRPVLCLIVPKDLNPVEGGWLIFDQPSAALPEGGVYKITSCQSVGNDRFQLEAQFEPNFAAPYAEMTTGKPILDDAGNFLEDGGIVLDLASHLSGIVDDEGNAIPFSIGPNGDILFSEEATAMLLREPETKAMYGKTFSPPKVFFKHGEKNAEVSFGAKLSLNTRFSGCFADGEVQYLHLMLEPVFELSADFVLKAEFNYSKPFHLINLIFTPPIMIAPGVLLTVNLDLSGEVGIGGNVQFSTSVNYTYNMGRFILSYTIVSGFDARRQVMPAPEAEIKPDIGGASASVFAYGKLTAAPYFSLYGMLGFGVEAGFSLKFGAGFEDKTKSTKLFLTPELELIPSIAVLGGRFTKRFSDLSTNIEFDPIWERYLSPKVKAAGTGPVSVPLSEAWYDFPALASMQVTKSPREWSYYVELEEPTPLDYNVELRVYESHGIVDDASYFYYDDAPEESGEPPFEQYLAAGIPHMYFYLNDVGNPDMGAFPVLVSSHIVGSYPSETERKTFEGHVSAGSIRSGHAYWSELYLVSDYGSQKIGQASRNRVYYWPTDFRGNPYHESDIQGAPVGNNHGEFDE